MPRGDKSGPQGMGPMTGRRLGTCAGADAPGFVTGGGMPRGGGGFGWGRGFGGRGGFGNGFGPGAGQGRGRGFGRGYGWQSVAPEVPFEMEIPRVQTVMADEITGLKSQLASLEAKLSELLDKD